MGTLVGHVAPGFGFLLIGLWHLLNHTKFQALNPNTYTSLPWFPSPKLKHLELILIMLGSTISIAMELFIGPERHQPFDPDGTIPSNHLHNFEHASISLTFFIYAFFAMLFDRVQAKSKDTMTQLLGALAFGQQLLLFHLHSSDHMGVEGQYHWLLQIVIFISLSTTLLSMAFPNSFSVSFVRSASIAFQGVWFIVMGYALWTPEFIAKGCFMNLEEGHRVVRCHDDESLHRAKSLVNIQFSWFTACFAVFLMVFYLIINRKYSESQEYVSLENSSVEEDDQDLEAQKKLQEMASFVHMGKGLMRSIDLER
ncbi:hypothetical protein J5N97_009451 [Dioscorea zingiberensis]|uniref:Transmembrane protein 45A-like n=1 Tax=Dioscorea zingiberensis TaxID=325984 RepID=A0A9D5HLZ6_9LILI|nr:hypothetical protein J5N97_009451 [Dioscorea zingiberensis]